MIQSDNESYDEPYDESYDEIVWWNRMVLKSDDAGTYDLIDMYIKPSSPT